MARPRKNALVEIGGQWIAAEPGSANLYRFWNDPGTGRTRRASLGTADLEIAKRKLAELIVTGTPKTADAPLSVVLEKYFTERTDKKPSKDQSRNAGKVFLRHFGLTVRVSALTEAKQKEFAETALAKGQKLSYVARNMTVLNAALRHSKISHEVIYTESKMREHWDLQSSPKRKARIFTDEEFAKLWSTSMSDDFRRFLLIQMGTGGRPQTALDLTPVQRTKAAGLVHLNPPKRAQNNEVSPGAAGALRAYRLARQVGGGYRRHGDSARALLRRIYQYRWRGIVSQAGHKTRWDRAHYDLQLSPQGHDDPSAGEGVGG